MRCSKLSICNNPILIASSVVFNGDILQAKKTGGVDIPALRSWIAEADAKIVVNVDWEICAKQCKRVKVVSNDNNTFAHLLYFIL